MSMHPLFGHPHVFEVAVPVTTVWTSPEAPRDVDAPAVAARPDPGAWTAAMDAATRRDLNGRTLTQLLLGEGVRVVEERGDWVEVRALMQPSSQDADGYPGWVRRDHLAAPVARTAGASAFVMVPCAPCTLEDGETIELSFGTGLWLASAEASCARVLLPGGRTGTVALGAVRLAHERQQVTYGADDLLDTARQFLGLRYLWGGTSGWGLDCSGLVHLIYRALGAIVPRDAFDQADAVTPVPLDDVHPGDLYFFARPGQRIYHVGFASRRVPPDGIRWMLHAPEGGELVEDAPLAPHRRDTLVAAGRVSKPNAGQRRAHNHV